MSPIIRYHAEKLREMLLQQRIATMEQLKQTLGTGVDLTVFRKLKELSCHTSYSHRGRYYTLEEIARFDELGLWSFNSVWFSKHGTLMQTIKVLVETSEIGCFVSELEDILNVSVKDALRKLFEQKHLHPSAAGSKSLVALLQRPPSSSATAAGTPAYRGGHKSPRCFSRGAESGDSTLF